MTIGDHSILADMFDFIENKRGQLTRKLDFTLSLPISSSKYALHVQFELPHTYPLLEQPYISVRTTFSTPNRSQIESEIKKKIFEYIEEVDKSTVYVYPIIVWLQENMEQFLDASTMQTITSPANNHVNHTTTDANIEMERLWVYSHHLKSTTKRQDILKLARELDLTGFSKPGKPGIICVEGQQKNTQEFWKCIRQWAWQRITVRLSETKTKPLSKCSQFRRFEDFRETMCGTVDGDTDSVAPINMSEFMKFLESHNSGYVKKELLLLE